ncbi:unnamed protein product, partial [Discosporangium mesarthrocarpum]
PSCRVQYVRCGSHLETLQNSLLPKQFPHKLHLIACSSSLTVTLHFTRESAEASKRPRDGENVEGTFRQHVPWRPYPPVPEVRHQLRNTASRCMLEG